MEAGIFFALDGQCSFAKARTNPSPWSIFLAFILTFYVVKTETFYKITDFTTFNIYEDNMKEILI